MNRSTRLSLSLLALCPAAAMAMASSATAFDWWGHSSPLSAPTLGGIYVGNPADLPEEETDSFMDPTSNDPPTIESVLNAWGTSTGNADLDTNGIVDGFDLLAVLDFELGSSAGEDDD